MKDLPATDHTSMVPARRMQSSYMRREPALDMTSLPAEDNGGPELFEYLAILQRRKVALLLFALLGVVAGVVATLPQQPLYAARTTVEFQAPVDSFTFRNLDAGTSADYSIDPYIQTQIKILQSNTLLIRVINQMLAAERKDALVSETGLAAIARKLGVPGLGEPFSWKRYVQHTAGSVVVRTVPGTRVVELVTDSPDPRLAADFLNILVREFTEQNLELRWQASQRTSDWLTAQLEEIRAKLQKSEQQLQQYSIKAGLIFSGENNNIAQDQLKQVQAELSRAQADRIQKQAAYEIASASSPDTLPQVIDNTRLSDYQSKLADLRRDLAELTTALTGEHYKVVRVQAQISKLEETLQKERNAVVQRITNDYEAALARERLLTTAVNVQSGVVTDQGTKSIHYDLLKRDVDANRQLYDALLQRLKESSIATALRVSTARVIDEATPAGAPYRPNLPLNCMLGLTTGCLLGIAFVFASERFNRNLRSPGECQFYLDVPELGVIPSAKSDPDMRLPGVSRMLQTEEDSAASQTALEMATWHSKPSLLAESFRVALTSILFSDTTGGLRTIVLTSANAREGKTTVASNLAIALAEIGRRVVIIDADMRKPRLHRVFDLANSWGLSDLLRQPNPIGKMPLDSLVRTAEIPRLSILPSGPGTVSVSNLLYSPRMQELLERFRREFDIILIDTPPMLQIPDARVLGRLSDGVVLVIRAGVTDRQSARLAKERLAQDRTPILGTILNDWDPAQSGQTYRDYYSSYFSINNLSK